MGDRSQIEWTDATWNPITGCSKVSPGCAYCYAERVSTRYGRTTLPWIPANAAINVVLHPDRLQQPFRWRKPRRIFVNSMSDLFHDEVPDRYIERVFAVMAATPRHTFQVLTKRPERMRSLLADSDFLGGIADEAAGLAEEWYDGPGPKDASDLRALEVVYDAGHKHPWPLPNVWLGVSAENQHWAVERVPVLLRTPAAVRFVSAEPLLGPLNLRNLSRGVPYAIDSLTGEDAYRSSPTDGWSRRRGVFERLDWVIVGGESGGPGDRRLLPCSDRDLGWVRSIRDQCAEAGVAFLFKQWGGALPTSNGRELDGRTWDEYPAAAVPA